MTAHPKYIDKDLEKFIKPYKHIFYHKPKIELSKYGPAWAWDDYNYYFQAERSEMPIYGNVIQVFKKSNGEIEIIPDNYKINLDFEQKETEKKYGKGVSALDVVKAKIRAKHGKDAIMEPKKSLILWL